MSTEAQLIERYFLSLGAARTDVALGIGDDAALLDVPADQQLVLTTDTLVEGRHFLPGAAPHSLGHRALAVNLSDLAAMGATPAWALLSLNLPAIDDAWLRGFAAGFDALARAHQVALAGGNLTRGPLSITVQLAGLVPRGCALRRDGGRVGDLLCVSGTPGDAALGLEVRLGRRPAAGSEELCRRFDYPEARVQLGLQLRSLASACIDVSDGLYADIARLAAASSCGAVLQVDDLPLSVALCAAAGDAAWRYALGGGEDYELAFAMPVEQRAELAGRAVAGGVRCTVIGRLRAAAGIELHRAGSVIQFSHSGFDHFEV
jgi:thiamine-monophosphate kinase